MASKWRPCTIGDLCDAGVAELQTGPFGSQLHAYDYVDHGIPVVPTEAIRNRQIDHAVLPKISRQKALALARHRLRPGDILFARRGAQATGQIGCVREAEAGFICGTGAIRLRLNERVGDVKANFLSHVLANPRSVEWFKFQAIGATMPNLNEDIIRSFPLVIPPLPEQQAIARILGTLDDKIESNRLMNETLDAMARAIFNSWFVDFDPVRAKAEGRHLYGIDGQVTALFPNKFQDSALGRIPLGWRVSTVGEELTALLGGTPSRSNPGFWENGTIPWINSGKVNEFRIVEATEFITEDGLRNSATKLLPERTTVLAITGATLGQVSLLEIAACANQSVVAILGSRALPTEFVFFWVKQNVADLTAWETGGAQQHINKNNVNALGIVCPSEGVIDSYVGCVRPLFDRIKCGLIESLILRDLRDALLPKLISGEIRVKDVEKVVEKTI